LTKFNVDLSYLVRPKLGN